MADKQAKPVRKSTISELATTALSEIAASVFGKGQSAVGNAANDLETPLVLPENRRPNDVERKPGTYEYQGKRK